MSRPALDGLRVLDLTGDMGRFATKLLTEMGAEVVRVSPRGSHGTPMADPGAAGRGGVLDWWYDGGKERLPLDLDDPAGRDTLRALAAVADVIVDDEPVGRLAGLGLGHEELSADNPALVQVSLSPFGASGPWAHHRTSDLVAGALGGVLSVTGLPDAPLNSWGRQNYNFGGFQAALCALAGVAEARRTGRGAHVDVSLHETVALTIENLLMQWIFDDVLPIPKIAPRQGSLHWLGAYEVAPARTGHVMITPTPTPDPLLEWMVEDGLAQAREFQGVDVLDLLERMEEVMGLIKTFVARHDASELWWEAQRRHIALGGVMSVPEVAANPQFAHRDFLADTETAADHSQARVTVPGRLVRWSATPPGPPRPPAVDTADAATVVARWGAAAMSSDGGSTTTATTAARGERPLAGIRIADFTWVLAGPFATRLLGDLGADVIRIQTEERATGVNDPSHPYFYMWNRSKRSATLDMSHPDALAAARRLIEASDVLIENYSAGVLDRWGLDWDTVREWNPRLVYVSMSGCGHDGPWSHVISYAPTVHALCGLTHLTNPPGRGDVGLGFSLNDHAAGFAAAVATLGALTARDRTGEGQLIDMAQLEVGSYLLGPALIDHLANGRDAEPAGNRDGLVDVVPNEVYPTDDGHLAVTCSDDEQWAALVATLDDDRLRDPELATVEGRRRRRDVVDDAVAAWCRDQAGRAAMDRLQAAGVAAGVVQHAGDLVESDPQMAARAVFSVVEHPLLGTRLRDRFPALWNGRPLGTDMASPYLGEHTLDVWTEVAGYDLDDVAAGIGDGLFA